MVGASTAMKAVRSLPEWRIRPLPEWHNPASAGRSRGENICDEYCVPAFVLQVSRLKRLRDKARKALTFHDRSDILLKVQWTIRAIVSRVD